jgi:diaminopimelate decarboxylase
MTTEVHPPLSVRNGHLYIEDCDTTEIAKKFGTPLFVVSEAQLVANARAYKDAFEQHWPEGSVKVMAAVKACPVTAVRRVLTREGICCDTFGFGELECALRGGVAPENIAVNGSAKGRDIIRRAIDLGCYIVLDNPAELTYCQEEAAALGKRAKAVIRMKPFLEGMEDPSDFFPGRLIRDMTQTVKYGIPTSELMDMLPRFKDCPDVDPVGAHIHIGRHTKKLEAWEFMMECYAKWIKRVSDGLGGGWVPKVVSIGGGFAAEHDIECRVAVTDYQTPTVPEFAEATTRAFREAMRGYGLSTDGMVLEVEPGRAIHNETGIHLAEIRNVKHETENMTYQWIETDTSEVFLSVGGLNVTPPFPYVIASKADQPLTEKADIVGITCNYECLMEQGDVPAGVEAGDTFAFMNTGSYIEVYTCNFNCLPRPGMVLVSGDKAELIKQHETLEQVFSRDVVPERLQDIG